MTSTVEPVIVLGYEDSPAGRAALRAAAELCTRLRARLHVVHAVPLLTPVSSTSAGLGAEPYVGLPLDGGEEERERIADAVQAQVAELLDGSSGRWTFAAQWGPPVEVLTEQADEVDAYLLVVGAHGHGLGAALERLLSGSTSRGLERRTRRPLLVVPVPDS